MTAPKPFDDAERYMEEIRLLIPGYYALHAMVPAVLGAAVAPIERVLAVGCGPALEAVAIARAFPGCVVDAIDPSPAMAEAARRTVAAAAMEEAIVVHAATLAELRIDRPYDAAIVLLVGHLIPDDGARASFLRDLGRAVRPRGVVVLAELEDVGPARALLTEAHLRCSHAAGVLDERLETMRERLTSGFHAITRERLVTLLDDAGLSVKAELFRAFGIVGLVLERGA
ncbi:MAG: class I SAM-dependent methyltransferase [Labilithrix sp.]|nr:class I SAM-dependent methyltransferase [Labilithrix sp.]MCW5812656.1 class I SAM-dependent methyltransferase [Labilithrix sp.]